MDKKGRKRKETITFPKKVDKMRTVIPNPLTIVVNTKDRMWE
jgi:hypothetical protein